MRIPDMTARAALLLRLDGTTGASGLEAPRVVCPGCGKPLVRIVTSVGLRAASGNLPATGDFCVTTQATKVFGVWLPCPEALRTKPVLDALMEGTR